MEHQLGLLTWPAPLPQEFPAGADLIGRIPSPNITRERLIVLAREDRAPRQGEMDPIIRTSD